MVSMGGCNLIHWGAWFLWWFSQHSHCLGSVATAGCLASLTSEVIHPSQFLTWTGLENQVRLTHHLLLRHMLNSSLIPGHSNLPYRRLTMAVIQGFTESCGWIVFGRQALPGLLVQTHQWRLLTLCILCPLGLKNACLHFPEASHSLMSQLLLSLKEARSQEVSLTACDSSSTPSRECCGSLMQPWFPIHMITVSRLQIFLQLWCSESDSALWYITNVRAYSRAYGISGWLLPPGLPEFPVCWLLAVLTTGSLSYHTWDIIFTIRFDSADFSDLLLRNSTLYGVLAVLSLSALFMPPLPCLPAALPCTHALPLCCALCPCTRTLLPRTHAPFTYLLLYTSHLFWDYYASIICFLHFILFLFLFLDGLRLDLFQKEKAVRDGSPSCLPVGILPGLPTLNFTKTSLPLIFGLISRHLALQNSL